MIIHPNGNADVRIIRWFIQSLFGFIVGLIIEVP